jgi:hypothetical protein
MRLFKLMATSVATAPAPIIAGSTTTPLTLAVDWPSGVGR